MKKFQLIFLAILLLLLYSFKMYSFRNTEDTKHWQFVGTDNCHINSPNLLLVDGPFVLEFYPGFVYTIKMNASIDNNSANNNILTLTTSSVQAGKNPAENVLKATIQDGQLVLEDKYAKGIKYFFKQI